MPDITPSYGNACCADFPECSHPPRVDRMPVVERMTPYLKRHPRAALAVDWLRRPAYRLRVTLLARRLRKVLRDARPGAF